MLEAIVALVLISGAGLALFSWINSNISALARVQDANSRSDAMSNVLDYMSNVNPMLRPEGRASLGSYQIVWQAQRATAPQDGVNYPRGVSLYQLALYDTQVTVSRTGGEHWFTFRVKQAGYKRVRSPAIEP